MSATVTDLQALIIRAASSAAVWSEASATYQGSFSDDARLQSVLREAHDAAKKETLEAGAALAKALRAAKVAP